jgi:hypothetical protein
MAINAPISGNYVLISVEDGTIATAGTSEEVIGHQTNVVFNETLSTFDVSSKANAGSTITKSGRYGSTVTCDALYVPSDTALGYLRDAIRNQTKVKITRRDSLNTTVGGSANTDPDHGTLSDFKEADAWVTSLSETFPMDGAGTISVSFQVTGNWGAPS